MGAYHAGSINWLPDDADLPPTSDLDINLVIAEGVPRIERFKLTHRGVLLEISHTSLSRLRSPEQVLGDFALAGGFRVPSVLLDPTGHLTALQSSVSRHFADPDWVRRRCEDAQGRMLGYLGALSEADPLHHQMIVWLFGTSIATLLPLIAGRRNPTVRRRYAAAREILAEHGRLDLYEHVLEQLGCATMSRGRVEHHLDALTPVFEVAAGALRSSFPFGTDITDLARPAAFDGSRDLIERGLHREAVFWLAVTYSRCQTVLAADHPAELERFTPAYRELLADLGITSLADLRHRAEQTRASLPEVMAVSEQIVVAP